MVRGRSRLEEIQEDFDIWPAFTDLMSNAFMILSFLLLLAIIKPLVSISSMRETEAALREQLVGLENSLDKQRDRAASAEQRIGILTQQNQALAARNQALNAQTEDLKGRLQEELETPKAPPIIVIRDTGSYRFESGSAQVPDALESYVRSQLVPQIEANAKQYQIDVVEIIGHTDGQPNESSASNLDRSLEQVARGNTAVSQLVPGSNADLGLMRSLAVVQILQNIQKNEKRLQGLEFRAYSAAQLVSPSGGFADINRNADETRRRIEIRFTRLGEVTSVQ
ncbi:flagellar motor protein [Oxynema aestuarii]|jgi:flagellar motor protein MotB|uniref:Flagellar motor protein n=1 Tax=Oxynema aestuarii AP17 TaxID=2064643 RepID=A0A6H1TZ26_9CYAN|nr:flagellar motor protein [Oxynema aestuarii]QIZ71023.1 flagellar motor protein [Oxynema aestuarii AP17]RMH71719.1 MAG: flagellar motor protein [Cyanobacteria bacterium J007]